MHIVWPNHKMVVLGVVWMVALWFVTFLPVKALAQGESGLPDKILVGTLAAPPFVMKTASGRWEGLSNKEIASRLFIAPETVKTHLQNIYRKLDAKGGRVAALQAARTLGLIALD